MKLMRRGTCRDPQQRLRACMRLIAKMPTLAALAYRTSKGLPIVYPRNDLVRPRHPGESDVPPHGVLAN